MNLEILGSEMWRKNYSYIAGKELIPIAAHLSDGTFAVPSESIVKYGDDKAAGLHVKNYAVIPAKVGEDTTSLPGNHGTPGSTPGETILEWINRIEQQTGKFVVAVTMREHSGYKGKDYKYHTEVVCTYDFEDLRDRILDAIRRSDDNKALIDCALRLSVSL